MGTGRIAVDRLAAAIELLKAWDDAYPHVPTHIYDWTNHAPVDSLLKRLRATREFLGTEKSPDSH
jgi:hypothetical protein